jgi:predicted Rossmann fold nucleotide-binding protein DprA/Smf involved in DNA uptake
METIAVIGSRNGVDRPSVESFLADLWDEQPETVLISGGARGVDTYAEKFWIGAGGEAVSLRPVQVTPGSWGINELRFGQNPGSIRHTHPTWADVESALLYRNMLIVDRADRVVAFHANWSPGTAFSKAYARDRGKPIYDMIR